MFEKCHYQTWTFNEKENKDEKFYNYIEVNYSNRMLFTFTSKIFMFFVVISKANIFYNV